MVKDIRRQARRDFSAKDKIRIVLDGLRGHGNVAEFCGKEGIAESVLQWSNEFMEVWNRIGVGTRTRS